MVLDDIVDVEILKRLEKKNVLECLRPREIVEITFGSHQKWLIYVGGALNRAGIYHLVYSHKLDALGNLEHPDELPLSAIEDYKVWKESN